MGHHFDLEDTGKIHMPQATWVARITLGFAAAATTLAAVLLSAGTAQASAYDDAPPDYAHWVDIAEPGCEHPAITPALIAAQLDFASGYDQQAISASGAHGPAQYIPSTWDTYGVDGDGNGTSSPFDIGDAVTALVREDCTRAKDLEETGKSADTASVAAAWYGGTAQSDDPYVRDQIQPLIAQL